MEPTSERVVKNYYILKYATGETANSVDKPTMHSVVIVAEDAEGARALGDRYAKSQKGRFISVTLYPA